MKTAIRLATLALATALAASGSVAVVITTPRYSRRDMANFPPRVRGREAADCWPHRPYKRVEWWRGGKQVRDEILARLADETEKTRNAVAQFLATNAGAS